MFAISIALIGIAGVLCALLMAYGGGDEHE